jgi:hypothetical protein
LLDDDMNQVILDMVIKQAVKVRDPVEILNIPIKQVVKHEDVAIPNILTKQVV